MPGWISRTARDLERLSDDLIVDIDLQQSVEHQ